MIYRSNLVAPDLTPNFKHLWSAPMGHSFGHDVPRDWADKADDDPVFGIYRQCGLWTHDEAAILFNVASCMAGRWADIGAHTGWTTSVIARADCLVDGVDPMLALQGFSDRFEANTKHPKVWENINQLSCQTSVNYFDHMAKTHSGVFEGFCIDGDHDEGAPLKDAIRAERLLGIDGVIIFHDFIGRPVREAVEWCLDHGFKARVYITPHVVACCWRGIFIPPDHRPDPALVAIDLPARMPDFDFSRCS
jgi:hypothetical protein